MSTRDARFEIVRTDAGHHARFVAANGQTVWVTESYRRRKAAERAIELIVGETIQQSPHTEHPEVDWQGNMERPTEVLYVDERAKP